MSDKIRVLYLFKYKNQMDEMIHDLVDEGGVYNKCERTVRIGNWVHMFMMCGDHLERLRGLELNVVIDFTIFRDTYALDNIIMPCLFCRNGSYHYIPRW